MCRINQTLLTKNNEIFVIFMFIKMRNSLVLYEWNYWILCNNLGKHNIILIGWSNKY